MAYASITKPSLHTNTKLYTGTGAAQSLTGLGFQPDWTWIKPRSYVDNNVLFDAVRGVDKRLISNDTNTESTVANMITAFDSDGFSIGDNDNVSRNSETLVAWNWKANGAGSSNSDGTIGSHTVSVNTTADYSIVKWTGTGDVRTIGHGLGVAPSMIIVKNRDASQNWLVYHKSLGATKYVRLNLNNAEGTSSAVWNDTEPTTSVFTVGTDGAVNANNEEMIAYCFADIKGYSKFGKYVGNVSADGSFVYTGFKPAFLMVKMTNGSSHWSMFDNKRLGYNTSNRVLYANETAAEETLDIDLLSNGFKCLTTDDKINDGTYIYMAFAAEPLVANVGESIPATAR